MKIIQSSNGRQITISGRLIRRVEELHGSQKNAMSHPNRELKPSYFLILWWKEAVYETLKYGRVIRHDDNNVDIFMYRYREPIGFNPETNVKQHVVRVVTRNGTLISAYPW